MFDAKTVALRAGKLLSVALLTFGAGFFANATPLTRAAAGEVIIVDETVSGGLASREATTVTGMGKTPVLMSAAAFSGLTAAQVAAYDAVAIGDATCRGPGIPADIAALTASAATWGPAITGNVFINGTDPVFHDGSGGSTMTSGGVKFAASEPGKTGAYISLSCYYHGVGTLVPVPLLSTAFGAAFTVRGVGCYNNAHIVATHPSLVGATDALWSNWSCSVHEAFDTWPAATFEVLAIARDIGASYTAPDGSVGTPYVLARGKSLTIISDIKLTPLDATNPVGTQHTVTAKVTKNDPAPGTPVVGTEVKFEIIAGPHAGLTGTDITDANGEATFTWTGTTAGTDIIEATFKDAAGATQRSNRVTKLWVKPAGPCDDLNGGFERGAPGLADCWTLTNILDGISRVEDEGSCFGANNTKGITFVDGRVKNNRALNVRSSAPAPEGSIGIATSDPFTFGTAIHFKALSENDDAIPAPEPVKFEWRLLNAAGDTVLDSDDVVTNILTTSPGTTNDGCLVGDLRDGAFSSHIIETEALAGQTGRLQFRQHTEVEGKGFFTLVDDVAVVVATSAKPAAGQPPAIPSSGPRVGPNPNR